MFISITLGRLLEIENSAQLIREISPNSIDVPVWCLIRSTLLRMLIGKMYYREALISKGNGLVQKLRRVYDGMEHAFANQRLLRGLGPQKILISTAGSRYQENNGGLVNILSDYFFDALESESLVIESFHIGISPAQRYCKKVISNNPYYLMANVPKILRRKSIWNRITAFVEHVKGRVETSTGICLSESEVRWLVGYSVRECERVEGLRSAYGGLFRSLKIKLLLLQCAGAGGADAVAMTLAARDQGIVVSEFQHGLITQGNDAYNYAEEALNSVVFQRTLPDYILTYGTAWCCRTNSPANKIAIGSPLRDEAKALHTRERRPQFYLTVLGDGVDTEAALNLCVRIASMRIDGYVVLFRPHPAERSKLKNRDLGCIEVDHNTNVYATLYSTAILIGETSTVLYEAIGIVQRIVLWETPKSIFFDPYSPFLRASSIEQIADILGIDSTQSNYVGGACESDYWSSNWCANYRNFANKLGL